MSYENIDIKALTVIGFYGALTFTAMILLMQFSTSIQYSEILIPWTAIVSFFFIMETIIILNVDSISNINQIRKLAMFCFLLGFYGLIFIIPALVYSFNPIGAGIILVLEIIIVIIFNRNIKPPFD